MPRSTLAAGYCRISTEDQLADSQREQILEISRTRGVTLDVIFEEVASGASDRPILDGLERRARSGGLASLWIVSLDRLGRSLLDVIGRLQRFDAAGCRVVVIREGLDLSTPAGRLQAQLLAAFGEFEKELIRERTRQGLAAARARGSRLGRPPVHLDEVWLRSTVRGHGSIRSAARALGISHSTLLRMVEKRGGLDAL